jgi:hypothetical protein
MGAVHLTFLVITLSLALYAEHSSRTTGRGKKNPVKMQPLWPTRPLKNLKKKGGNKYPVEDATLVAREALGLARAELAEILRSLAPGTWRHMGDA